jgi:hypothetical protein
LKPFPLRRTDVISRGEDTSSRRDGRGSERRERDVEKGRYMAGTGVRRHGVARGTNGAIRRSMLTSMISG